MVNISSEISKFKKDLLFLSSFIWQWASISGQCNMYWKKKKASKQTNKKQSKTKKQKACNAICLSSYIRKHTSALRSPLWVQGVTVSFRAVCVLTKGLKSKALLEKDTLFKINLHFLLQQVNTNKPEVVTLRYTKGKWHKSQEELALCAGAAGVTWAAYASLLLWPVAQLEVAWCMGSAGTTVLVIEAVAQLICCWHCITVMRITW